MAQPLSGPGVGLPLPQNLYPSELFGLAYDSSNPYFGLEAGEALTIPAGDWYIGVGQYSILQYLDPQTGLWRGVEATRDGVTFVKSDGFTTRIANLTGCPVGGVVTAAGSGYVAGSTTVTPSAGNSTWSAVVGGKLTSPTVVTAGSGFTIPPLVFIPGPPVGGMQATAVAALTSGAVSSVTLVNAGGGYIGTTITATILPSPFDPNLSNCVAGSVTFTVGGAGTLAGVLCTNPGETLAAPNSLTLTVAGNGTGGTASPVVLQTVSSASVTTNGAGYPDSANLLLTSAGGRNTAADAVGNPTLSKTGFVPRPVNGVAATTSAGAIATANLTIYDGGLFTAAPSPLILDSLGTTAPTTVAVVSFTMGGVSDTVFLQPAP